MSRVTLTGKFTRIDGTPATGTVRVTPSRSPIMDSAGRVVISGPQSFPVQSGGLLEVEIPASNDPDLGPAFTYRIEVILDHASWKISKVWIPHGSVSVDLSEIGDYEPVPGVATRVVTIPADGEDGQVLVWDGVGFTWADVPPGPPGEVTTAALTAALAGKVTGTGMTVRVDTSVGTRVLLDHPNGTLMLSGDTGWRDVSGVLSAGNFDFSAPDTYARARRIGDQIDLQIRANLGTNLTGRNRSAQVVIWTPTAGYVPRHAYGLRGTVTAATSTAIPIALGTVGSFSNPTRIEMVSPAATGTWAATDFIQISASWSTAQAWPSTALGNPA